MALVAALIPWLALAPWMTRFGVGRTASGQIYGLWPGDLARPRIPRYRRSVTLRRRVRHDVKEIVLHKGKQLSMTSTPHYCEDRGVTWKIDFSGSKNEHVVTFGSCSSADADG